MSINFFFPDTTIKVPERKRLKQFINHLFESEFKTLLSLTFIFCTDNFLLSINQEFLKHDTYTDIITFCLSHPSEPIVGEIYISTERVKENAINLGLNQNNELHRVIFHGALHLCGYKDKSRADKKKMTKAENKYLGLYFN